MQNQTTNNLNFVSEDVTELTLDWDSLDEINPVSKDEVHTSSISDALVYSLKNLGKVDIEYIAKITGSDYQTIINKLKGSIYKDPADVGVKYYEGFKTSDEYLSGNLFKKLEDAKNYNVNGVYDENIKALEAIMPAGVSSNEIYFNLASPWIPHEIIKEFFETIFVRNSQLEPGELEYDESKGIWDVSISKYRVSYSAGLNYGNDYISAANLFEKVANCQTIALYDYVLRNGKRKRIFNEAATQDALAKASDIEKCFKKFLATKPWLNNELVKVYNEKYGYNVSRTYNGSFLDFPYKNPDVTLFEYQKNAIARIIFNPNTLLAHEVGTGKTYIMIASGEELLRMGLSTKNLYVVPNNIVSQWKNDYKYLYPNSNLLATDVGDYTPDKIVNTLKLIKDGDYNAVIMPQSSFDRIPYSVDKETKKLASEYAKLKSKYSNSQVIPNATVKRLKKLREALDALAKSPIKEEHSFRNLGFTRLYVDESHNYKNIPIKSSMTMIRGINLEGSDKCQHFKVICDHFNSLQNGGIILATGTPITNSISDLYNIQRCLQPTDLTITNIVSFDNWIAMYAEFVEEIEVDLNGEGYRPVTRLSKFHNLPELTQILSNIADFYSSSQMDGTPKLNGYKDITIAKSKELAAYIADISKRIEKIRKHQFDEGDDEKDNLLKVTSDGRKAALDLRIIDENKYANYSDGKVRTCAINILNNYIKTNSFKGTQLVFCDISTPKPGFNIYDELKTLLIKYGIPEFEIAFIHDANDSESKRNKLFKAVNDGTIRVLIGSTQKLGTGVNVQQRLYAIHHLDVPWKPSDMIQREGRILRRGNTNEFVEVYRYIAEGSFDAYSWQLLETKQRFIAKLLSNSLSERTKEDVDSVVLDYAEVKALATGNKYLKEHIQLTNELSRLHMLNKKHIENIANVKRELLTIPDRLQVLDDKIEGLAGDVELYDENKVELSKELKIAVRSTIWNGLIDNLDSTEDVFITKYMGFNIFAPCNSNINSLYLIICGNGKYFLNISNSEVGCLIRLENFLNDLPKKLLEAKAERADLINKQVSYKEELEKPSDIIDRINECANKLKKVEEKLNG